MPDMHLREPGVTYSACGPFTKSKENQCIAVLPSLSVRPFEHLLHFFYIP